MPNNAEDYKIVIGTFINNKFIWHDVDSFDNLEDAYKAFKKYVQSQLKYSDEELKRVWDTGRLDIELRKGKKLLNWIGVYAREVDREIDEEIEEEEQKSAKDSASVKDSEELQRYTVFYDTDDEENIRETIEVESWFDLKDYINALKKNGCFNITVAEDEF